jgi:hypothetical protein
MQLLSYLIAVGTLISTSLAVATCPTPATCNGVSGIVATAIKSYAPAQTLCSSKYPVPRKTCTSVAPTAVVTSTVATSTSATTVATTTITAQAAPFTTTFTDTTTPIVTSTETDTVTVCSCASISVLLLTLPDLGNNYHDLHKLGNCAC